MMRSTRRLGDRAVREALQEKLAVDVHTAARALAVSPESIRRAVSAASCRQPASAGAFGFRRVLREKLGLDRPEAQSA